MQAYGITKADIEQFEQSPDGIARLLAEIVARVMMDNQVLEYQKTAHPRWVGRWRKARTDWGMDRCMKRIIRDWEEHHEQA